LTTGDRGCTGVDGNLFAIDRSTMGRVRIFPGPFFVSLTRFPTMIGHKFVIGQLVDFDKSATPAPKPIGPYEVLRVQPADDVRLRAYRIKSKAEPFERSAREYEIVGRRLDDI
jgi:hypothetical protein